MLSIRRISRLLATLGGAHAAAARSSSALRNASCAAGALNPAVLSPGPDGLPQFSKFDNAEVEPAITALAEEYEASLAAIEGDATAAGAAGGGGGGGGGLTWDALVPPLERLDQRLDFAWGLVTHLDMVQNTEGLRAAKQRVQPLITRVATRAAQSEALYRAARALGTAADEAAAPGAEAEARRRVLRKMWQGAERGGVGLAGAPKERFNAIQLELAELSSAFTNNVLDSTKSFGLLLTEQADVAGFPPTLRALCAASANAKAKADVAAAAAAAVAAAAAAAAAEPAAGGAAAGAAGAGAGGGAEAEAEAEAATAQAATAEAGPWRVTLDAPCFGPLMQHAEDRGLRERVYRAYVSRASSHSAVGDDGDGSEAAAAAAAAHDNADNIARILALRQEQAALLGYASFAAKSLDAKMAPSVQAVLDLTADLRARSRGAAEQELAELQAFADSARGAPAGPLKHWDLGYWSERQRETLFSFTDEQLRPYFPLPRVLEVLFSTGDFSRLLLTPDSLPTRFPFHFFYL